MVKKTITPKIKVISGVITIVFLVINIRGYVRAQLNLPPINFNSQEQLRPPSGYNPFDHPLEKDMIYQRQLESNRQQWANNINSQMYAYEQNDNLIEKLDVLFMFLAIASSGGWIFYCSKVKGKNPTNDSNQE
jgi:hypothetical protein